MNNNNNNKVTKWISNYLALNICSDFQCRTVMSLTTSSQHSYQSRRGVLLSSQRINSGAQLTPPPDLLTQVQHYSLTQEVRGGWVESEWMSEGSQLVPVLHRQILARTHQSWHGFLAHSPAVTQSGCIFGMEHAGSQGATGDYFNRMSTTLSHSGVSTGKVILERVGPDTKQCGRERVTHLTAYETSQLGSRGANSPHAQSQSSLLAAKKV